MAVCAEWVGAGGQRLLRDREPDVLRFAHDLDVPPTSNQAERDLRPAKLQQNISGRLTSEPRTKDRYRIRGYLSTAAKHGHNMLDALRQAILGRPWMPPDPTPPPSLAVTTAMLHAGSPAAPARSPRACCPYARPARGSPLFGGLR